MEKTPKQQEMSDAFAAFATTLDGLIPSEAHRAAMREELSRAELGCLGFAGDVPAPAEPEPGE